LRFCLRVTVAALSAFALAQAFTLPLHGLWAVLTAMVVSQMSVGGSLRATSEYVIGTFGGAIYASIVGLLIPHTTGVAMAGVLALAVAPLAYAAAVTPTFRVAPFTAVLVLLVANQLDEGPIGSGLSRLFEVALGGFVAVTVSVLVVPERAHGLGLEAATRIVDELARALPELLAGFMRQLDMIEVLRIQDELGRAVPGFQAIAAEAHRERVISLVAQPDAAPLSRTLLRLRHDFVMVGRAAAEPLPDGIADRLHAPLVQIGATGGDYLHASAGALASRRRPPPLEPPGAALEAYAAEIEALRAEGRARSVEQRSGTPVRPRFRA